MLDYKESATKLYDFIAWSRFQRGCSIVIKVKKPKWGISAEEAVRNMRAMVLRGGFFILDPKDEFEIIELK